VPAAAPRFVVNRLRRIDADKQRRRLPGAVPVSAFTRYPAAQDECLRLESEARRKVNPFTVGGPALFYQTGLDAARLHDWLLDHGVTPPDKPEAGHGVWLKWWDARHKRLSEQQRAAVWEALDKVRFFEVSERPRTAAYGVVGFLWKLGVQYGDDMESDCEGGTLRRLCRSRRQANRSLAVVEGELRAGERSGVEDWRNSYESRHGELEEDEEFVPWVYQLRRLSGPFASGTTGSVEDIPLAEIVEIPIEGELAGSGAYLVQRVALDPEGPRCTDNNGDPTDGQVPLALYPTRKQADRERDRLEGAVRRLVNPFAFPDPQEGLTVGDHFGLSSHTYSQFRREIRNLGLPLPDSDDRATVSASGLTLFRSAPWLAWWDKRVDAMSDEQREAIWDLLDLLRFHSVSQVRLED
jgi:hypothetical protein